MEHERIQRDIICIEQGIVTAEDNLIVRRERLEQAQIQLAIARTGENKKPELENGDYGKALSCWVFVGGKVLWEDGSISEKPEKSFTDSRKGNYIREMEERQE